MSFWFRTKPAAELDARDETIARQAVELGTERAGHAQTRAQLEAANRWAASEQRARQRAEGTHSYLTAQLRKAHAVAITLIEAERDKAQAQLTSVRNANVNALLEKLNDTIGQLDKANSDLAVLRGDNADLRTQLSKMEEDLGKARDAEREAKRALADERNGSKAVAR